MLEVCGMSPAGPARGEDATRCRNSAAKSLTKPAEAYGHKVCAARGESKHIETERERRERKRERRERERERATKGREREKERPPATKYAWPEVLVHPLTHAAT